MDKAFATELLTTKVPLFLRILRFNGLDLPPAEILAYKGSSLEAVAFRPEVLRRLKRQGPFFFDFNSIEDRFCLLTESELKMLRLFIGAAICSDMILKAVKAKEVLAIKNLLGESIYKFAVGRGQFYMSPKCKRLFIKNSAFGAAEILKCADRGLGCIVKRISVPLKNNLSEIEAYDLDDAQYVNFMHTVLKIMKKEMESLCLELSF